MYRHEYRVYRLGELTPYAPMRNMTFTTPGEALEAARRMFPSESDNFMAC